MNAIQKNDGKTIETDKGTIYGTVEAAQNAAADLTAGECDGWTYTVVPIPTTTKAKISVRDDDGVFVAWFGF